MLKLKVLTAAVLVTLSAGAFAAAPTSFTIFDLSKTATLGSKTITGSSSWNYAGAFDLDFYLASPIGSGTFDFTYSLKQLSTGHTDDDNYHIVNSTGYADHVSWEGLTAGSYLFSYTGKVFSGSKLNYTLTSNILPTVPAPVPEPETYAMLLAGLGLMGAIAKRRKDKQA